MLIPVDKSMTVSAPHFVAQRIFSTSSSMDDDRALLPMLALILTRKLRPMIIGSHSGWLMFAGMIARPRATSLRTNSGVISVGQASSLPDGFNRKLEACATLSRPRFSRIAINSISGVTIPCLA
jgi:hypothetical protein